MKIFHWSLVGCAVERICLDSVSFDLDEMEYRKYLFGKPALVPNGCIYWLPMKYDPEVERPYFAGWVINVDGNLRGVVSRSVHI